MEVGNKTNFQKDSKTFFYTDVTCFELVIWHFIIKQFANTAIELVMFFVSVTTQGQAKNGKRHKHGGLRELYF